MVQVGTPEVVVMTIGINPEVGRNSGGAVRGPGTRVPRHGARKLRDKGMPAVEIAEVWRSPGPPFIGTCPRQKATNPDTGVAPPPLPVLAAERAGG